MSGEGGKHAYEQALGKGFRERRRERHGLSDPDPADAAPEVVGEGHGAEVIEGDVGRGERVAEVELVHEGEGEHVVFGEEGGEGGEGEG